MEADWDEIARVAFPPPGIHVLPTPVNTLAFDTSYELLWAGNQYGRVTSFYGPELQKYTSYRGHLNNDPVYQLLFNDRGVVSLASKSVHMSGRRGLPEWHITHPKMTDLRCMSFTSRGTSEILVAGHQGVMFLIDVEKGHITREVSAEDNYTLMKLSRYICASTTSGTVNMLDLTTFKAIKKWKAHTVITDMDVQSDFLVTCGHSNRQQHTMTGATIMLDPLANVFDLKSLAPLPPIPFHAGAAFVRMHPRMSTTGIVASHHGQMQVVDLMNPNAVTLRQANLSSFLTHLELAPSGESLVMADQDCLLHLWGALGRARFTDMSTATEFADVPAPLPQIDWHADTPLSSVGLPHYREKLLSAWPSHLIFEVGNPPQKIDPDILATMTSNESIGFAANYKKLRRNFTPNARVVEKANVPAKGPKFLSEKARGQDAAEATAKRISDAADVLGDITLADGFSPTGSSTKVPPYYQNVEIKYSRFGVDDFDFKYYNKTEFSGLETHIANSYANPLLQLIRFIPVLRNCALHHAATVCVLDTCLLCELGFLFDMLEAAGGLNCQATNFLKTLSSLSHASSLGLLDEDSPNGPLSPRIQNMTRFLLDTILIDYSKISINVGYIDGLMTTKGNTYIRCMYCQTRTMRASNSHSIDLQYPRKQRAKPRSSGKHDPKSEWANFSEVLKGSIEAAGQTRGWCEKCKSYKLLETQKRIDGIPEILMINTALHSEESKQYWATPGWLPERIGITPKEGAVYCFQGAELERHAQDPRFDAKIWELVGVVADIKDGAIQTSHLVSLVDVSLSSRTERSEPNWHLFNDFLVRKLPKEEALKFNPTWKLPTVLSYQRLSYDEKGLASRPTVDDSWKDNLDTSLLYYEWPDSRRPPSDECRLLDQDTEAPKPKDLIAIDSEFVALQQEEIEVKADGTRETVRPSRLALARLSVCRGAGDQAGVPFIDDYIETKEPVIDYLTAFSGIHHGDLDLRTTAQNLVPLKVAYKKMWLLLHLGCIFIGHGLIKDFRTINIYVPKAQVIDTVDLFQSKSIMRKLKLRFLAWFFLKEDIQLGDHDSVEDARTALKLYRKWEEFTDAGILEQMLGDIYRKGRELGFNPPTAAGATGHGGTDTPPILSDMAEGGAAGDRAMGSPSTPTRKPAISMPASEERTPGRPTTYLRSPLR